LIPQIKKILPPGIQIIDSGEAVARQTQYILQQNVGFNTASALFHTFYTNSNPKVLKEILNGSYDVIEKDF
jgi:glutamate racemase